MIRSAISTDLPALQQIEVAAGEPFRDIGMDAIADDPPPTLDELNDFLAAEHIWVQTDANDVPVAYALVEIVDGGAHIEQVSVHPDHARKGLGAQLIDAVNRMGGGPSPRSRDSDDVRRRSVERAVLRAPRVRAPGREHALPRPDTHQNGRAVVRVGRLAARDDEPPVTRSGAGDSGTGRPRTRTYELVQHCRRAEQVDPFRSHPFVVVIRA